MGVRAAAAKLQERVYAAGGFSRKLWACLNIQQTRTARAYPSTKRCAGAKQGNMAVQQTGAKTHERALAFQVPAHVLVCYAPTGHEKIVAQQRSMEVLCLCPIPGFAPPNLDADGKAGALVERLVYVSAHFLVILPS